jgi:single-strand selective monofunctional uracil DNA glycosylase
VSNSTVRALLQVSRDLSDAVSELGFGGPITHVYNPLIYAREPHEMYLERWATRRARALLIGMNPGPFGMAQTGVPFGDVAAVRDFLGITGHVGRPAAEHPKRPVLGFACQRGEVSGARLWGYARDRFMTPDIFFQSFFVANYCPLVFMEASGANRTPDKLPRAEQRALFAACDAALVRLVKLLAPEFVIGVGAFAAGRAGQALSEFSGRVASISHPSPASPRANRGWSALVEAELRQHGLGALLPAS